MSIKQKIWSLKSSTELKIATIQEKELEDFVCSNIAVLDPDWLVIGRQVQTYSGLLDVLCIDRGGGLVLIELKRDKTPRDIVAQALDYASYLPQITTEDASEIERIFTNYSKAYLNGVDLDTAYKNKFNAQLDREQLYDGANPLKIVLVATELDERTERILEYLRGKLNGVVINVMFFSAYEHAGEILLSRAWKYDLTKPEVEDSNYSSEWNEETYVAYGTGEDLNWEDAREYGFVAACGGPWYSKTLNNLQEGDRVWVHIPGKGYVGVGRVTGQRVAASEFKVGDKNFYNLPLHADYMKDFRGTDKEAFIVPVKWDYTVPENQAYFESGFFGNQNTVVKTKHVKWNHTVEQLKKVWNIRN